MFFGNSGKNKDFSNEDIATKATFVSYSESLNWYC